ncbi:MAG: hypothetical protein JRM78_02720 [Nitrososphaerota archaeon]|nr:hypothetical protein [Nitrososphaerota archaeon]MDG7040014.1 hypothetical protein [Nitrososphaerota archaeon]
MSLFERLMYPFVVLAVEPVVGEVHGRKHGDDVLKAALTTAVRGAIRSRSRTSVKKLYNRMISQKGQGTTGCSSCSSEEVSVHSLGHTYKQETICRGG